jgi:hypothetical protein
MEQPATRIHHHRDTETQRRKNQNLESAEGTEGTEKTHKLEVTGLKPRPHFSAALPWSANYFSSLVSAVDCATLTSAAEDFGAICRSAALGEMLRWARHRPVAACGAKGDSAADRGSQNYFALLVNAVDSGVSGNEPRLRG